MQVFWFYFIFVVLFTFWCEWVTWTRPIRSGGLCLDMVLTAVHCKLPQKRTKLIGRDKRYMYMYVTRVHKEQDNRNSNYFLLTSQQHQFYTGNFWVYIQVYNLSDHYSANIIIQSCLIDGLSLEFIFFLFFLFYSV